MNGVIIVFCILSFTLTIDYSLSLISAEAYWTQTGGNEHTAGFVFGIYDATTIFVTPLLALYIGKGGSYKKMFIAGLIINIIGNALYALAYVFRRWEMIICGRGLAGLGATTLPMLMVYITNHMDKESQKTAIGYTKYVAAVSRILGPALGSLFTMAGVKSGLWNSLFNVYTLVGWIPICFALVTIIIMAAFFQDPDVLDADQNLPINNDALDDDVSLMTKIGNIISKFWTILMIGFASTFIYWMYMGNSFVITTHFYHVVSSEHQLWHIYITGFAGFILAFLLFMVARDQLSSLYGLVGSIILFIISLSIYFVRYDPLFYVAVGATTFAYAIMIPSLNIINNDIAKKNQAILGNKMALAITMLTIVQSVARFVGPFMFITFGSSHRNEICNFTDPDKYVTHGCQITNYYMMSGIYIGVTSVAMLISSITTYVKLA